MPTITGGKYIRYNDKRFFTMSTAIAVDGSTDVPVEAVQGSIGVTTHATGKSYWFVSNGTKWIANGGAVSSTAFADITGAATSNASLSTALAGKVSGTSGVKVYRALLTQTGTDAPVATVLENTLGGTIVWTYEETGIYTGTLTSAFTANKTFTSPPSYSASGGVKITRTGANTVSIDAGADDVLNGTSIEILVYP